MYSQVNRYSKIITQSKKYGAAQAMLRACKIDKNNTKPMVGVISMWYEGNPCNMKLNKYANIVKQHLEINNMNAFRSCTTTVSDGISMGTSGMNYSLPSRELQADSIETMLNAHHLDGGVIIPGCDKNLPASVMGICRVNRPSMIVYGGSILPGIHKTKPIDIVDAFQSYGQEISGVITSDEREEIIDKACPCSGSCGGMYTANTMAIALEVMGITLPNSSSNYSASPEKIQECRDVAKTMEYLLVNNITPKDIITQRSIYNAIKVCCALGGSTNMVIHILAIANELGLRITLNDFELISKQVPYIGNLKPSGEKHIYDLYQMGGTQKVIRYLYEQGYLSGDTYSITGKTLMEQCREYDKLSFNSQDVIRSLIYPIQDRSPLHILKGNISPNGCVAKISGKEGQYFSGPARVFDSEQEMLNKLSTIQKGDVVVIRYQGPKGGPGMPEMLLPTSAIVGAGLEKDVALITDGRFSGGSHGFIIGHISPEAYDDGPIAYIKENDIITIDIKKNSIECESLQLINKSKPKFTQISQNSYLTKYKKLVGCSSKGCLTI